MGVPEQEKPKTSRLKIVIIILSVLLALSIGGLAARYVYLYFFAQTQSTVTVPDNLIRGEEAESEESFAESSSQSGDPTSLDDSDSLEEDGQTDGADDSAEGQAEQTGGADDPAGNQSAEDQLAAAVLELYEGRPDVNQKFEVKNMFPGDIETKYFCIRAYHRADLELFLKTEVTEQTKNLGEVLNIRITHLETGKVLCDAPFAKINGSAFSELLKKNAADETIAYYQIDVFMDNSVGNAYQGAALKADFKWYVRDESALIPPKTGDTMHMILWMTAAVSSALLIFFLLLKRRRKTGANGMSGHETAKKLTASIVVVIALAAGLGITTFALAYSVVAAEGHFFQTGQIKINLNDGKPVIEEDEFLFEPGMTVEKTFFLENQGTWDVYYKLYLDHVAGGLADVLDVSIRDGDNVLYSGKAAGLQKGQLGAADDVLKMKERRELTIVFHYPETGGNSGQDQYLTFDLKADVVQTKNNPGKQFD